MNLIDFDHNFYGRRSVLEVLKKRVMGLKEGYRQNVALLGDRYIGKTALLHRLMSQMEEQDVFFLYLDLENRDFDYFAIQFTKSLLYNFLKTQNVSPLQEDLKLLCAEAKDRLPRTVFLVQAIEELTAQDKILEAYHMILSLPEIFTQETGKSVVLIFDEFGHLENFNIPEVFAELGKRIMTQKNCLYVFASSYPQRAQMILSEKLSLLFGNFEIIPLEPFNFGEAQGLIDHNLDGVKIGLHLKNFMANFMGGHPLYINLLCQELICLSGVHAQQEIYAPIVTQAIENVIFNPWGVISRHFELQINALTGKCAGTTVAVLGALAQGKHKISDLQESLQLKTSQIAPRINALQDSNMVERNGNYYHIKDKLFSYWIKYVFQRRLHVIDLEVGRSRKQFKEEINRALNDFGMVARKDLSARIADLMHKFDNESFVLCGRRYKLTTFRDIKVLKLRTGAGNYFDAISAQGQEGSWLVVLKKDPVHDNDLNGILEEIKKLDPRPLRSVIVSLSGLDENAKVRALQEKLWIWDEDQLNSLMHLFDEPIIVR